MDLNKMIQTDFNKMTEAQLDAYVKNQADLFEVCMYILDDDLNILYVPEFEPIEALESRMHAFDQMLPYINNYVGRGYFCGIIMGFDLMRLQMFVPLEHACFQLNKWVTEQLDKCDPDILHDKICLALCRHEAMFVCLAFRYVLQEVLKSDTYKQQFFYMFCTLKRIEDFYAPEIDIHARPSHVTDEVIRLLKEAEDEEDDPYPSEGLDSSHESDTAEDHSTFIPDTTTSVSLMNDLDDLLNTATNSSNALPEISGIDSNMIDSVLNTQCSQLSNERINNFDSEIVEESVVSSGRQERKEGQTMHVEMPSDENVLHGTKLNRIDKRSNACLDKHVQGSFSSSISQKKRKMNATLEKSVASSSKEVSSTMIQNAVIKEATTSTATIGLPVVHSDIVEGSVGSSCDKASLVEVQCEFVEGSVETLLRQESKDSNIVEVEGSSDEHTHKETQAVEVQCEIVKELVESSLRQESKKYKIVEVEELSDEHVHEETLASQDGQQSDDCLLNSSQNSKKKSSEKPVNTCKSKVVECSLGMENSPEKERSVAITKASVLFSETVDKANVIENAMDKSTNISDDSDRNSKEEHPMVIDLTIETDCSKEKVGSKADRPDVINLVDNAEEDSLQSVDVDDFSGKTRFEKLKDCDKPKSKFGSKNEKSHKMEYGDAQKCVYCGFVKSRRCTECGRCSRCWRSSKCVAKDQEISEEDEEGTVEEESSEAVKARTCGVLTSLLDKAIDNNLKKRLPVDWESVFHLIESGADVNYQRKSADSEQATILMIAARESQSKVVDKLLQLGANPNLMDKWQNKAYKFVKKDASAELRSLYDKLRKLAVEPPTV